ncbi:MAG: cysteine--tRNA ligase, partial [Candidatus Hermodarchaeota archaeon]
EILGIKIMPTDIDRNDGELVKPLIDLIVYIREDLRSVEMYSLSDRIREKLMELGIVLEDKPTGTVWKTSL